MTKKQRKRYFARVLLYFIFTYVDLWVTVAIMEKHDYFAEDRLQFIVACRYKLNSLPSQLPTNNGDPTYGTKYVRLFFLFFVRLETITMNFLTNIEKLLQQY